MSTPFIFINHLTVNYGTKPVLENISFQFNKKEAWAIRGHSGSGKTTLGKALAGLQNPQGQVDFNFDSNTALPPKVLFVENWYRFANLDGDRNFYYQQRYNHQQKRETVSITRELELFAKEHSLKNELPEALLMAFDYHNVLSEQLFEISSGEHKKLQLIKALWWQPQCLIIDQPYTGLDANSRKKLNQLLNDYVARGGHLILLSNDDELPSCINRFATIENGKLNESSSVFFVEKKDLKPLPYFLTVAPIYISNSIVDMKNVSVKYDDKYVLSQIYWQVNAGERWLLQGPNGSGKSTLLSLITADHPQAYANNIKLFGVKRGGGESIWDIKKRIGLISPELHWYFDANATVAQSIASGFFDSNGQYQNLRYAQKQQLYDLLHFLDLYDVKDHLLQTLPLGKQRLALLGRTIIKDPQLLVLDEPCQGLDQQQTQYFNKLVDAISSNGVTIIYVGHFASQLPKCITHKLTLDAGKISSCEKLNP